MELDIQYLKGVGPVKAKKLNRLGLYTVNDLLNYLPLKYEDRRTVKSVAQIEEDDKVLLKVRLYDNPKKSYLKKNMSIIKVIGKDDTGFVSLTFFNQDFLMDKLNLDEEYYVFGKVKKDFGKFEMVNPEIESVNKDYKVGRIMPIYGLTNNLSNNELTKLVKTAIEMFIDKIEDVIPEEIKAQYNLIERKKAIKYIHFPPDGRCYSIAKKTIAFEKLLVMQIGLLSIKKGLRMGMPGIEITESHLSDEMIRSLPYELTNAQKKVIEEIKADMRLVKPMNRLVQGDVGSGKTVVSVAAMLTAVGSGFQSSMMAPTEILALQHYETVTEYIRDSDLKVNVSFLSGSTKQKVKREILDKLKNGDIDILIGTHALIEKEVEFKNIGLVITDEQHRFGVRQRALLSNKGKNPDILVMTATPIPRTLALMFYGDLDISVIDEMPPGRQEIITKVIKANKKEEAYKFIKQKIDEGRQAYIVAPLIEESESMELDSAEQIFKELSENYFAGYRLAILHGKMKNTQKDEVMKEYYDGQIDILIATTVIEVGVNVPNAAIIAVLNSERFGLAQLHQLRGRVGRGKHQSYCILVNEGNSHKSRDRMNILKISSNGFEIAEEDLRIRGPGDFFGTEQHGLSKYDLENIISDVDVVHEVQLLSKKICRENPYLNGIQYINLKKQIISLFDNENIVFN